MAQKMILISCSDGRITGASARVREFTTKNGFDVGPTCVYRIKIPGPDGTCTGVRGDAHLTALRENIGVLVEKARPALIAVAGHCDCAGFPVSDDEHLSSSKRAATRIKEWFPEVPVLGLIDYKLAEDVWKFEQVIYHA